MINISESKFKELKNDGYSFPIQYTLEKIDVDPIDIYMYLKGEKKFIFERYSETEGKKGYVYMSSQPYKLIKSFENIIIQEDMNSKYHKKEIKENIFDYLKKVINIKYTDLGLNLPFTGGAIGYLSYDTAKLNENIRHTNVDELEMPDSYLMFYKYYYCYDRERKKLSIIYNVVSEDFENYTQVKDKILKLSEQFSIFRKGNTFKNNNKLKYKDTFKSNNEFESNFSKEQYENMVRKAKEYIKKGDVFQVVLSQRLKFKQRFHPLDVYRKLKEKNPSPYLFYIDYSEFQIVGSSPETLVTLDGTKVYTNPIAGTKKRGKNKEEDERIKEELLKDEKEIAEHLMLVDLGRNDIGKISEFGTVNLDEFMKVHYYSHVMHIVSKVSGTIKNNLNAIDALKASIPVGTVSGAPKVRAMEIIEELENVKRGVYSGAIGYFSFNGNMDTCIAIRTIVFKDGIACVQAGAGIVYDSNPEMEYFETINKAMVLKEVL